MNKIEQLVFVIVAVVLVGLAVMPVGAQPATAVLSKAKEMRSRVDEDKKPDAPKEVTIPDPRADKVRLLQAERENLIWQGRELERQMALINDQIKEKHGKLEAEMVSALRLAGVLDGDFAKYKYDQGTLKFTLQPETPAPATAPPNQPAAKP